MGRMVDTKPKLPWYQHSLRTLLLLPVLSTILCSLTAVKVRDAWQRRTAVRELEKLGADVRHDPASWR